MKNKRAFGLLQVTNAVSGISNGVVMITVPWIVLELTGSAAKAGLLAALSSLPGIVVSPVVGGLIDRFGRRAISMFSDFMSMVSVLMLTTAHSFLTRTKQIRMEMGWAILVPKPGFRSRQDIAIPSE